jgi:ribosomal protein S18 acetylase RimI-like enzyme
MGALSVRAWRAAYPGVMPQAFLDGLEPDEWTAMWWAAISRPDRPGRGVLVDGGLAVGFAAWGPEETGEPAGRGELYAINLDPDAWGRGAGGALLAAVCDGLAAAGYGGAVLWTAPSNDRAAGFYRHGGWRPDGARRMTDVGGLMVETARYHRDLP